MDAEYRLARHDLAPLRLVPAPRRILLRGQESLRAAARAVFLRRPLHRRGLLLLPAFREYESGGDRVQPGYERQILARGEDECRTRQQHTRLHSTRDRGPYWHMVPQPQAARPL